MVAYSFCIFLAFEPGNFPMGPAFSYHRTRQFPVAGPSWALQLTMGSSRRLQRQMWLVTHMGYNDGRASGPGTIVAVDGTSPEECCRRCWEILAAQSRCSRTIRQVAGCLLSRRSSQDRRARRVRLGSGIGTLLKRAFRGGRLGGLAVSGAWGGKCVGGCNH